MSVQEKRARVAALANALEHGEPVAMRLDVCSLIEPWGWRIQGGVREARWHVWSPEDRSTEVRWALGPPAHVVGADDLREILENIWLPQARAWLATTGDDDGFG